MTVEAWDQAKSLGFGAHGRDCIIQLPVGRLGKYRVITVGYELVLNRSSQHPRRETAPRERIPGLRGAGRSTPFPKNPVEHCGLLTPPKAGRVFQRRAVAWGKEPTSNRRWGPEFNYISGLT